MAVVFYAAHVAGLDKNRASRGLSRTGLSFALWKQNALHDIE